MNSQYRRIPVISFLLMIVCISIDGQGFQYSGKKKIGYYVYAGSQWEFNKGSGLIIPNPNLIDPTYPGANSIRIYPNLSYHIGGSIRWKVTNSLNLGIGIEWNVRKDHYRIHFDTIQSYIVHEDYRTKTVYNNLEIPVSISYNIGPLAFGGGVKVILWELRVSKIYLYDELNSRYFSQAFLLNISGEKLIYPKVFIEWMALQNSNHPFWITASYEFGGERSSTVYLSLKTQL